MVVVGNKGVVAWGCRSQYCIVGSLHRGVVFSIVAGLRTQSTLRSQLEINMQCKYQPWTSRGQTPPQYKGLGFPPDAVCCNNEKKRPNAAAESFTDPGAEEPGFINFNDD